MGEFFGLKTVAWFDLWSIEHFFSGLSIGTLAAIIANKILAPYLAQACHATNHNNNHNLSTPNHSTSQPAAQITKPPIQFYAVYILCLAYMWEAVEFYMEAGYTNIAAITYWFQGVEFWGNRLITDPLLTLVGGVLGLKYPLYVWPARIFSGLWLLVHIFIFPHSMYLHQFV